MLEEEQRNRVKERESKETIQIDDKDRNVEIKNELKNEIFLTQVTLNTEAKKFKGRGRALLEDIMSTARDVLENSDDSARIQEVYEELKEKKVALQNYLDSLW